MDHTEEDIATSHMANMPEGFLLGRLLPRDFKSGDNVEKFIEECDTFFQFTKLGDVRKELIVISLLETEDLRSKYKKVDAQIKGYKGRLRAAFTKQTTLLQDLKAAITYRQTDEEPEKFFETIEMLAQKIIDRQMTKETLIEQMLVECCAEKDLKRELCINKINGIEGIKEKIKLLHEAKTMSTEVAVVEQMKKNQMGVKTYRNALMNDRSSQSSYKQVNHNHPPPRKFNQGNWQGQRKIECWTCHKYGHVSRQCSKRVITCFACGTAGHIRRECPRIQCKRCNKCGHLEKDCYTNLNKYGPRQPGMRNINGPRAQYENFGNSRERGYYGNMNRQEYRRGTGVNQGRYIANVEVSRDDESTIIEHEYPKDNAPTEVEIVGALQ